MSASMSRKCPVYRFFNLEDGIVSALTMVDGGEARIIVTTIRTFDPSLCVCAKNFCTIQYMYHRAWDHASSVDNSSITVPSSSQGH